MSGPNYDAVMLGLKRGETVEQDGMVFFHTENGMRGAMNADDWRTMQAELFGVEPSKETGLLRGVRLGG